MSESKSLNLTSHHFIPLRIQSSKIPTSRHFRILQVPIVIKVSRTSDPLASEANPICQRKYKSIEVLINALSRFVHEHEAKLIWLVHNSNGETPFGSVPLPVYLPVRAAIIPDESVSLADFSDIRRNVPGEPGIDYPAYTTLHQTGFTCEGRSRGEWEVTWFNVPITRAITSPVSYLACIQRNSADCRVELIAEKSRLLDWVTGNIILTRPPVTGSPVRRDIESWLHALIIHRSFAYEDSKMLPGSVSSSTV